MNGSIIFAAFAASAYRQDIHSATYRCVAENTVGLIISRAVHLRAGEKYSVFPNGELHIRNTVISDSYSKYRCKTRHLLTNETRISDSQGVLHLSEPSNTVPPRIIDSKSILSVREGSEMLEVPCAADGWPIPQYKWYKMDALNKAPVYVNAASDAETRLEQRSGSLIIKRIRPTDAGKYICIAVNSVGEASIDCEIRVYKQLAAEIKPEKLIIDSNQRAIINCSISGYPQDEVIWLHNGQLFTSDSERRAIQVFGSQSILMINEVTALDIGMYQCVVKNDIGDSAQASAQLILGDVSPYFVETFVDTNASVGDKVSLKCTAGGSPLPMITWTLDGLPFEERKLGSEGNALRTSMWGDFVVFGKAQVVSHINVTIESVYDGGHYECTASNVAGQVKHSAIVHVSGATKIREMQNKNAIAMQSISLPCYTLGTKPQLIQWKKEISNLDKEIDSGKYTCVVTVSEDSKDTVEQSVVLNVKVPPVIEDFRFSNRLQAGMRTRISCNVAHGDQPVEVVWLKDGKNISGLNLKGLSVNKGDQFSVTIIIENLSSYHNGNYTCIASNEAASVSHTTQLLVNVPPVWVIEPKNTMVVEGNAVTIDCVADGYPTPQIIWKRLLSSNAESSAISQQYQLIRSGPHYQVYENGSLRISKSRVSDRGMYLCQATNGIGAGLSTVVQLTVNVAVHFEHWQKIENITVVKGSPVQMVCKVFGDQPITMQWKRDAHIIQPSSETRYSFEEDNTYNGLVSRLNISAATRKDSTVFTCVAANQHGIESKSIYVTVKETAEPPYNIEVQSKSSRSVTLKWELGFNGNSKVTAIVAVIKKQEETAHNSKEGSVNITLPANQSDALIRNLQPATKYTVVLFAINSVGSSKASEAVEMTTDEEAPEGPPTNIRATVINATSVRIDWFPPRADSINGELKGYYVGYKVYNSSDHFLYKTVVTNSSSSNLVHSLLLQGLKAYTNYVIILQAFNAIGAGPRSDELIIRTHESVPSVPPTSIQCTTLSSTSFKVLWDKLSHRNVNGHLLGYKISYKLHRINAEHSSSSGSNSLEQIKTEISRDHSGLILYGLEKFANYSLKIAAFTAAGDGPFSDNVYCATDEDVPSAPSDIKALVESVESIVISWRPPLYPNGRIKSYTVYTEVDGGVRPFTVPKHLFHHRVSRLKEGKKYSFWVKASTSAGEGMPTRTVTQTPSSVAEARIVNFGERITRRIGDTIELPCKAVGIPTPIIEWYFNGMPVSKVTTKSSESEQREVEMLIDGSLQIAKLTKTNEGNYSCHASNAHGKDFITFNLIVDANKRENASPFPLSIKILQITNTSIAVSLKKSGDDYINDDGDDSVIAHEVYYRAAQIDNEWKHHFVDGTRNRSNETVLLKSLSCGTHYQIYAVTVTRKGKSAASDVLHVRTHGREPLASPASVFISKINSTSVKLNMNTWRDGGCGILERSIKWRKSHSSQWNTMNVEQMKETYVLNGLNSDTVYKVRVMMRNTAGHTAVEYEVQTSPFKIANIHRLPADTPEHVSSTHRNEEDESSVAPLVFTITLIILLTIATVLAILILHKAVTKRALFNNLNACASKRNNENSSCKEQVSHQSTVETMPATATSSELSVLNSTIDRTNAKNKMNAHKTMTTALQNTAESNAYQYLTIRKASFHKPNLQQQKEELYSVIQKRDNNTFAKQALNVDLREETMARYCTPKVNSTFAGNEATTPKENIQYRKKSLEADKFKHQEHKCCTFDQLAARNAADCVCCAILQPECCSQKQWQLHTDFNTIIDI
ncbi:Down syndrome cell adhesion molecule-like protein Dscam2, partial [Dinothrombium tinctorium]